MLHDTVTPIKKSGTVDPKARVPPLGISAINVYKYGFNLTKLEYKRYSILSCEIIF